MCSPGALLICTCFSDGIARMLANQYSKVLQITDVSHRRQGLNDIRLGDGFVRILANLSPQDVFTRCAPQLQLLD